MADDDFQLESAPMSVGPVEWARAAGSKGQAGEGPRQSYRYSPYRRGDGVLIDFFPIGANGEIKETQSREISHDLFAKWIANIELGEGIFFDAEG